MDALKECMKSLEGFCSNKEYDEESKKEARFLLAALREIYDALQDLKQQAHSHQEKQMGSVVVAQDERSCENIEVPTVGTRLPGEPLVDYKPKQAQDERSCDLCSLCANIGQDVCSFDKCKNKSQWQLKAQEQGVDWKTEYELLAAKYRAVVEYLDKQEGTPCEQIRHEHEVSDLRARLALLEAENAELKRQLKSEVKL